jgi:hypothetical protein
MISSARSSAVCRFRLWCRLPFGPARHPCRKRP